MELCVKRKEFFGAQPGRVHRVEQLARFGEIDARRCRKLRDNGTLQREAGLDDVGNRENLCGDLKAHQGGHPAGWSSNDDCSGLRPRPGLGADESEHFEHAECFAYRRAPDTEARGERSLGRQVVARAQSAGEQLELDGLEHELPGSSVVVGHGVTPRQ